MHVIIAGCGRVGSELAASLEQAGHSVAVIDREKRAFRRLPDGFTGMQIVGMGFDRETLDSANPSQADAFVAVMGGDNSNILSARIAKENYGISNVVARIKDPRRATIFERLGISTVASVTWTTTQIAHRILPEMAASWSDPSGSMSLIDINLPLTWAGKRLEELNLETQARVVAITRAGQPQLVGANSLGQEGDVLHVMLQESARASFESVVATGPQH